MIFAQTIPFATQTHVKDGLQWNSPNQAEPNNDEIKTNLKFSCSLCFLFGSIGKLKQ